METKNCIKCNIEKNKNQGFYTKKTSKDRYSNICKDCSKKWAKKHRLENREKYKEKDKKYYINNKEVHNKRTKKNYELNKDKYNLQCKQYYQDNKESIKKRVKQYVVDNTDIVKERSKKYRTNNHSKIISKNVARRAKKLNATPPWSEKDKILILYQKAKWLESLTGLKYHVDHIIPLQGKNVSGLHVWSNLQILEASENIKKSNK